MRAHPDFTTKIVPHRRSHDHIGPSRIPSAIAHQVVTFRLHAQCPFRVVRGAQILLGSYDLHWPKERKADKDVAFDTYATMYDSNAKILTDILADGEFHVIDAEMRENGEIVVEKPDSVRFEVFPACSGPVEGWRLFEKGSDVPYVYPDLADRD